MVPRPEHRRSPHPTTICRRVPAIGVALLLSLPALGEDVTDEAALVRAAVEGGVMQARIDATRARGAAAAVSSPFLDNPVFEARHEQANGPAGASTDSVGGTVVLGLGGGAEARAARLRGQAAGDWTRSEVVDAICTVRRDTLDAWLAAERSRAARLAQERLQTVLSGVASLA